ncbi:single-stranded DNA-binding protein [Lacibacter sp. MH-610]|uniref:single-stranded DNA-binding protein n=1 Tax=Lacibacter sp. MH-610 TaxID=3020883 RepID=UPI002D9F5525|nr:single-stranded DNA-binding protein [Chitinophagaceae bacterium]
MEIIGRMTADATVSETKAGKKVVNFSIAINDTYKAKGSTEVQKIVTYVNCSYWINPGVAQYLTKGTLVECAGRIGANAWTNKEGEVKASLTFHVNTIKLHGRSTGGNTAPAPVVPMNTAPAAVSEVAEDLPF